jgi:tetratricopeptide (TPR) repeat protein
VNDETKWDQVEEGIELLQVGELDQAVAELSRVAEAHADNEYAHFFLGNAFYEKHDFARALKCYVAAIELVPDYVGAMIAAGHTLRLLGDHNRALKMGSRVLRLRKDDPDGLHLLGMLHFQRGEHAAARGFLERFLMTRPEIEVALEVEGMLQICRGEFDPPPSED